MAGNPLSRPAAKALMRMGVELLDTGSMAMGALAAIPASMISLATFRSWRSTRRNRSELCGDCGGALYVPQTFAGPSLVQGKLVCEKCAEKQRRKLKRALVTAALWTGGVMASTALVAIASPASLGRLPWLVVAGVAVEYTAIFGGALAWMKRANRRAAAELGIELPSRLLREEINDSRSLG